MIISSSPHPLHTPPPTCCKASSLSCRALSSSFASSAESFNRNRSCSSISSSSSRSSSSGNEGQRREGEKEIERWRFPAASSIIPPLLQSVLPSQPPPPPPITTHPQRCGNARVYGCMTTAMHDMSTLRPPPNIPVPSSTGHLIRNSLTRKQG